MTDIKRLAQDVLTAESLFAGNLDAATELASRDDEGVRGHWDDLGGWDARAIARLLVAILND